MRRFDGQRYGRFDFDDHIHCVSNGLRLPGLHSLLRPEGLLLHLCNHIRTELYPVCAELQATGLLERSLETTASSQEGLDKKHRRRREDPQTSENCDLPPEDLASKQMFNLLCVYNKRKN